MTSKIEYYDKVITVDGVDTVVRSRRTVETVASDFPAPVEPTNGMITEERDRRIALGFTFQGQVFQSDPSSLQKINGAATGAIIAKGLGADPASVNWAADSSEFSWVSADNTIVPMSPDEMLAFGMSAMAHVDAHTKAARVLKDAPQDDYTADAHWPQAAA